MSTKRFMVQGSAGMLGSAIYRSLYNSGWLPQGLQRSQCDLEDRDATLRLFRDWKPDYVFMTAACVGGIIANSTRQTEFLERNLRIQLNTFEACVAQKVKKVVFVGSSCIYPRDCPQPMKEEYLGTGPLEETNKAYAMAKLCGVHQCKTISKETGTLCVPLLPTNLYGPFDNFDLEQSHVIPGMMRRIHNAKMEKAAEVVLWGTGKPMREFMHVEDCAAACVQAMLHYDSPEPLNIGTGVEGPIWDLAHLLCDIIGYEGNIRWDHSKPDGTPRKRLDISRMRECLTGFLPKRGLAQGLQQTYEWALKYEDWNDWRK